MCPHTFRTTAAGDTCSISPQGQEAEESRKSTEARAQELAYSNKKLAAELDALHEAARAGAERDRRTLRALREGLAAVEGAVAQRAQKGYTQVGRVRGYG